MRFLAIIATLIALFPALTTAQERPNTILVLDASGSMWGQIDEVAKITIAQEVVTNLLQSFPADENLGLTIYGARTRGDCTDIQTVVEPGTGNRDAIAAAVASIKPLGKTPMTDAIIAAAQALRYTEDAATVILVSDGVETCNPDPCAAARLLEETGIGFTAHVIGFDVGADAEAVAQMQCIADETGGRFLTAANAAELTAALETVAAAPEPDPVAQTGQITFMAVEEGQFIAMDEPILWNVTAPDGTSLITDKTAPGFTQDLPVGDYTLTALRIKTEDTVTVALRVPPAPGTISVAFPVYLPKATLDAPDTAPGGSTVQIGWVGPDGQNDNIQVGPENDGGSFSYAYVRDTNPVSLTLPWDPGTYEFRYKFEDREIIATRTITVTPGTVTLDAPDQAAIASEISVTWTGPNAPLDTITIGKVGDDGYTDYGYTSEGSPLTISMPNEPGDYELRYKFRDRQVIATRPITVTAVASGLVAPDTAVAGSNVTVGWEGPGANTDFIGVGKPGDIAYINYTYTRDDNPLVLQMPLEPGTYDIRYYLGGDNTILTSRPITITALKVGMTAPAEAVAGATISVDWTGPNYNLDFIGVGTPGDNNYINYTYTRDGAPTELQMPVDPGTYEIRYYLGQDNTIAQRIPVSVTPLKVQLVAPPVVALADGMVTVGFDGPDYNLDFIGIGVPGGNDYATYTYTRNGNPLQINLPDAAGSYEIRYFLGQDNTVVARLPLEVTK